MDAWNPLRWQHYSGGHQLVKDHCLETGLIDIRSCSFWFRLYSFVGECNHVPSSRHVLVRGSLFLDRSSAIVYSE